jgi:hypothetical protein
MLQARGLGPSLLALALASRLSGCTGEVAKPGAGDTMNATGGTMGTAGAGGTTVITDPTLSVAPEPLHRLNRLEYNNTLRDLLGDASGPADAFPADAELGGFDNMAEGLSLTPALFSLYSEAAR